MKCALMLVALFACLLLPIHAQEKDQKPDKNQDAKKEKEKDEFAIPKRGRPGELTSEEEDRLDRLIDRFIEHDIGRKRDPQSQKDMLQLGHEAIPAIIRGINKSAQMSHSCPATMLSKKLKQLINTSEDEEVMRFVRENVGAGLGRNNPYQPLMRDVQVTAMMRQRQIYEANQSAARRQQQGSSGSKGPGSPE